MNNSARFSSSQIVTIKTALDAVNEAIPFGKRMPKDVAAVKAAVALGIAPPKTDKPFARKELKGKVEDGDWQHFLDAYEEPFDRNELELELKSTTDPVVKERITKKLRFNHFLENAIRNALWYAHRKATEQPNGHPPCDNVERVRQLIVLNTAKNIRGDEKKSRRPMQPNEAKLTACRYVVKLVMEESGLTPEIREDLMGEIRVHVIEVCTAQAHGNPGRGYQEAVRWMLDAEHCHRGTQRVQTPKVTETPAEVVATVAPAATNEAEPVTPRTQRVRKGHRIGRDGVPEILWAEVSAR